MSTSVLQNGAEIATDVRDSSAICESRTAVPHTLGDLLAMWVPNPPREEAMLRTTCARFADYLQIAVENVSIDAVERSRKGFHPFLESRKYGENSIRTYVNHVRILLNYASAAGWQQIDPTSEEWHRVIALAAEQHCADLARHLAAIRKSPGDVTFEDVDHWVHQRARQGLAYDSAINRRSRFWRILRDGGYTKKLPVCILREKKYGIPVDDFPTNLKAEVTGLLRWKQVAYAWDRPKDARHRPVTAKRLEHVICAVFGYAVNILDQPNIGSLAQLAQRHIIGGFIEWCINEREVKGQTLQRNLRLLAAVLRQHPAYGDLKLDWFKPLLDGIPSEPKSVLKQRKAEKYLPFATVQGIPAQIRAQRAAAAKKGRKQLALIVRNELLIAWLTVLPWRQRNIRECRIAGPTPNFFKAAVPLISDVKLPEWALKEQAANSGAQFWQFRFTEEETKTGCAVHALLPRQLIHPVEEYIAEFRNDLVVGSDPGTLFLNEAGSPLSLNQVTRIVGTETLRHGGRRVTPHLCRDVASYAWLEDHPQDYLTLSKMLWHASPTQVIHTYGGRFNESNGVCSMEAWLDERAAKRGE